MTVSVFSVVFMLSRVQVILSDSRLLSTLASLTSTVKCHHQLPGCLLQQLILEVWVVSVTRLGT